VEWLSRLTGRKAALVYPIPPAPPTVVLVPWFRSSGVVRVFSGGWSAAAAAFAPEAIAGTWPQLEALLPEKIPSLTHALIVVARADEPLVTLAQRRRLWNAFGVPVFQQIVGANGSLLGAECEAHDGLHIESSKFAAAGGLVEPAPCGCGRKTARLKPDPAQTRSAGAV
jgi:hypothetical protein